MDLDILGINSQESTVQYVGPIIIASKSCGQLSQQNTDVRI